MLSELSDTFSHPFTIMFWQISLYPRNPASPVIGPAVPGPEAGERIFVEDPDKVNERPYVGIPITSLCFGHPLFSQYLTLKKKINRTSLGKAGLSSARSGAQIKLNLATSFEVEVKFSNSKLKLEVAVLSLKFQLNN